MIESRKAPVHPRFVPSLVLCIAAAASLAACSAGSTHGNTSTGGSGTGGSTHTTSSTTSSTTTTTAPDECATLCATETMACPKTSTECAAVCQYNEKEVSWCRTIVTAAIDCLAKEPAGSFQCDTNGAPSAKTGVCTNEITAMNDCWFNGPPGGLPDQTEACTSVCMKESSLSCADPNCVTGCESGVAAGTKCNGAFAAYVTCEWKQAASSFACDTETPPRANVKSGLCVWELDLLTGCLAM